MTLLKLSGLELSAQPLTGTFLLILGSEVHGLHFHRGLHL